MRKRAERSLWAVCGTIFVVLAGMGLATVVGVSDWIGIIIVTFVCGMAMGLCRSPAW